MPKFDYSHAKEEVAQINAIVETCPDAVKEKCFELLFGVIFGPTSFSAPPQAEADAPSTEPEKPANTVPSPHAKRLPSNVLAFSRKYGITEDELGKLFMLDHEPILPVYKLPTVITPSSTL
jgi:hypothetical protein